MDLKEHSRSAIDESGQCGQRRGSRILPGQVEVGHGPGRNDQDPCIDSECDYWTFPSLVSNRIRGMTQYVHPARAVSVGYCDISKPSVRSKS